MSQTGREIDNDEVFRAANAMMTLEIVSAKIITIPNAY